MTKDEIDLLDKAYQEANKGNSIPEVVVVYCEECKQEYIITTKRINICQHLINYFNIKKLKEKGIIE